jgi:hypothetical protein
MKNKTIDEKIEKLVALRLANLRDKTKNPLGFGCWKALSDYDAKKKLAIFVLGL